ncbi:MAG: DUF5105 domain-containing protein [Atopobiaceae bacterium]|jgi:hypothetical protein|nr:DUF5105 domain-containing protein [Atopobiaceae bacterium]MCI2173775.1 DUF5105 domain-containing protein [Atopobiaceae bacterium]MCI2207583.1 DUF5105 domain-containing protein [Atopobiaceae bacterium]
MNKDKTPGTVKRVVTCAMAVVMAFACMWVLAGCQDESKQIQAYVDGQLDDLKTTDATEINNVLGSTYVSQLEEYGVDPVEFYKAFYQHFSYTDNGVTVDGSKAQVKLTTTNIDLEQVATTWQQNEVTYLSSSEGIALYQSGGEDAIYKKMMSDLLTVLEDPSVPTKSADVTINLVKNGNTWELADENEVYSALFAGADLSTLSGDTTTSVS